MALSVSLLERAVVLAVGGLLALLIACEPVPNSGLDGGTTSEGGTVGSCAFEGTYTMQQTTYKASGGAYCNKLLTELAAQPSAGQTLVFAKVDATTYQSDVADSITDVKIIWTLDAATCQLRNSSTDVVQSTDAAGAPVQVKLDGLTFAKLSGTTLTITSSSTVTTASQGAQGFPCNLDSSQAGTKR